MPNRHIPNRLKTWWLQHFKKDTLDWRSLSPDCPPLPFLLSETLDEPILYDDSAPIQNHSNIIIESISNNSNKTKKPLHSLFPILEESETAITDDSSSNVRHTRSPDTSSSSSTPPSFHPPQSWILDEERSKQRFAQMVLAAKQSHQSNPQPTQMSVVFDANGNIDTVNMTIEGEPKQQKFDGNAQCVPPEVAMNTEYQSEQAEVWILGVYLYNMLIGKYPFQASNDQRLFKRMLHANFSLPNELSQDAKDILRRMLAPDVITRASLDLVIYHPWLQPYRHLLLTPPPSPEPILLPRRKTGRFRQVLSLVIHGPFPPPKKPYRDLSHLGTRESVFARQKTVVKL